MVSRRLLFAEQGKLLIDVRERECRLVLVRGRRVDFVGNDEFPAFAEKLRSLFDGSLDVPPSRHDDGCDWQSLGRQWGPDHFLFGRRDDGRCVLKFWNAEAGMLVAFVELSAAEVRRWSEQLRELVEQSATVAAEGADATEEDVDFQLFSDCLRERDVRAFLGVARQHNCLVIVSVPDPLARQYIGRGGFLPQPPTLLGITRQNPPNAGLLAADPDNPEFEPLLESQPRRMTFEQYVRVIAAQGFTVAGESEGHILSDQHGNRYYPAYCLQGVYDAENGRNLWTPSSGALRQEFNARLGAELLQLGPLDQSECVADPENDGSGLQPRLPVLAFEARGRVRALLDVEEMRSYYEAHEISWPYPKRRDTWGEAGA